ncbi:MAG: BatD family protein [Nitrospinota bacterium]|nr:BatD family protein [Nitrospinota bacterium]
MNLTMRPAAPRFLSGLALAACALAFLAVPRLATAQEDISISASASRNKVPPGSGFLFTVTVEASGAKRIPDPGQPDFGPIQTLGKSTSQSMAISGLSMKISRTITYQLVAPDEGAYTIPPISVKYNGKTYSTKPVTITVDGSAPAPPSSGRNRKGVFQNPPGAMDPFGNQRHTKSAEDDLFVTMEVDRTKLWLGQQAVATFSFWRAVDLWEKPGYRKPKFEGFWVEELLHANGDAEKTTLETRNGRKYALSRIRYAIVPLTPGKLTVDPAVLTASVDPWSRRRKLITRPVDITVSPLPDEGAPKEFSGMVVSNPEISLTSSSPSVKLNDSLFLTFTVLGNGYLKPATPPAAPKGDWFDAYDPKISDELIKTGDRLVTKRTVEYPVIARKEGVWALPPLATSWFDPQTGKYERYSASAGQVTVTGGAAAPQQALPRSTIEPGAVTARYIKPDIAALPDMGTPPHRRQWIWGVIVAPAPLLLLAWVYRRRRERLGENSALARSMAAATTARQRLDHAAGIAEPEMFFAELDQAARGYLADKWNIPAPSVTREAVAERLGEMDNGVAQDFDELFSAVEMARYARPAPERMKLLLEKTRGLVKTMEIEGRK